MKQRFIHRILFGAAVLLAAQASFGQTSPTLIPFQGRLTNQQGVPYENGQYTLTFNLYSQAVGGSTVWTERHEKVGVINGMVNVFLGSINTFPQWQPGSNPQVSPFAGTKYLGITIDVDANPATADPEMVPRTMLVPAFYAQNAGQLAGFDWSAILQGGVNNPATGTIRGDKLTPASVGSGQIAPGAVGSDRIADGAVLVSKLADGAISSTKILDGSVTTSKIADDAVTPSKIAPMPVGQFLVPEGGFAMSQTSPAETALIKGGTTSINELQVSIRSTGRPIALGLAPGVAPGSDGIYFSGAPKAYLILRYYRQELNPQTNQPVGPEELVGDNETYVEAATISYPSGSYKCFDLTAIEGKLYKYYLKFVTTYTDTQVTVTRVRLYAYDL